MKKILLLLLLYSSLFSFEKEENDNFIKYSIKASYEDIVFSILDELSIRGFILTYRANIGKNVNKTSKFFYKEELFIKANKIGFCKSTLSLKMIKEDNNNLIYCPLSLAIYEKTKGEIIILYQKAKALKKGDIIMKEVNEIINNLIISTLKN